MIKSLLVADLAISQKEQQLRSQLIKKVHTIWIEGKLKTSLHGSREIDLHLEDQSDMLEDPWKFNVWSLTIQDSNQAPRQLSESTNIVQIYDASDNELLILGEPGAGKTTALLQLTRVLLQRAKDNTANPVPVVFNLSSWGQEQLPLTDWMIKELSRLYNIPSEIGQSWIKKNQILPMLDSLDEIAGEVSLEACIQAIINYHQNFHGLNGTPLVICCRTLQYSMLSTKLPLNRAVQLLPLTSEEIQQYLQQAGSELTHLSELILGNDEFANITRNP
ncbi:NACHT domain-containing protein [Dictyobacter kobayashii]|nr:NACHT domain-containing protein [Dictyobacter kobayashii]